MSNETAKHLGEKIKELRKRCHMSQAEFANALNLSNSIISGYERGSRTPSMDVIYSICNKFNLPKTYFFDESTPQPDRVTLDVTDLTDEQFSLVIKMVDQFRGYNQLKKKSYKKRG